MVIPLRSGCLDSREHPLNPPLNSTPPLLIHNLLLIHLYYFVRCLLIYLFTELLSTSCSCMLRIIQLSFIIKRYYSSIWQEPPESSECFLSDMSNEGNSKRTKFLDLPFSFSTTQLVPMVQGDQDRMHFSSPNTIDNHVIDSTSIQSHESNYINLDLTI